MTALAEKLKQAGVDTIGAALTAACTDALRKHPDNVTVAWQLVGAHFGYDFLRSILADMFPPVPSVLTRSGTDTVSFEKKEDTVLLDAMVSLITPQNRLPEIRAEKPYQPRVISQERVERRRQLRETVRSKYKNSGGVVWSDVGWHELHGLKRDGVEAKALLDAGPANVPNAGQTVGDVLGVRRIDEIIETIRAA